MTKEITEFREIGYAEVQADCYRGEKFDQVNHTFYAHFDGDMDSEEIDVLELSASTFPPGTKVVISTPICPYCKEEPYYRGPNDFACCDEMDWKEYAMERFS